ncbi:acetoin dehydrogenase dihydrolipoyllysine-residue acetyltransferase subunit (plasmid) [Shinella sumterensis]|jgi:pyruvate dehydrogenase E2 component (dihydrolipoamide acetyltransferase)|nr:acetoin dehydrogenase dihydrolipoyllysine-residue acetyltransferase subunit [Shinella sumterensis]
MTERILKMPRLGETMDEGRVVGWLIAPGDSFKRGDPIIEIETDKTIAEFPALGNGRLDEILVSIGDMVEVGKPLARIDIGEGPDWTAEEGDETGAAPESANEASGWSETDLAMPRLGETMEEGRIAKWLKAPGERFARGEAILEIETDKTIAEFPALHDGRMVSILRDESEMVAVGEPIARIEAASDQIAPAAEHNAPAVRPEPIMVAAPVRTTPRRDGRVRATPLARRLARRHGLDIAAIAGTGRRGRIERADVLAASGNAPGPGDVRFAALGRGRMAYSDSGPTYGEAVLLLHGFSGDRTTWAAIASGLKRAGRRVVAVDLPGHGLTEIEALDASDLGRDLPELLDALGLAMVDVVAHSLGAVAALNLADAVPERVRSLSLIAPAGLGSEIDTGFVNGMAQAQAPGEVAHLLRRLSVNSVDVSDAALAALAKDLGRGRLLALAAAITGASGQKVDGLAAIGRLSGRLPVRVLFGLEDRIIPWKHVLALPPKVAIHLLARSGHMPQWDQSKDVLDILTA